MIRSSEIAFAYHTLFFLFLVHVAAYAGMVASYQGRYSYNIVKIPPILKLRRERQWMFCNASLNYI